MCFATHKPLSVAVPRRECPIATHIPFLQGNPAVTKDLPGCLTPAHAFLVVALVTASGQRSDDRLWHIREMCRGQPQDDGDPGNFHT